MQSNAPSATSSTPNIAFMVLMIGTLVLCLILSLIGYFPAVLMGIVQGIGEFLPISSSAHLILVPWFFQWNDGLINTLTFDVALHIGTLIAVVAYFWRDWLRLIQSIPQAIQWAISFITRRHTPPATDEHLLIAIIIATLPGAIIGKLLEKTAESTFRSPLLLAATLSIMGLVLWVVDSRMQQARSLEQLSWRDALLIGLAQAAAIVPGFSRSGTTITAGRLLTFERTAAARFSFLLSAPITLAAVLVKLPDMLATTAAELPTFVIGVIISGFVGAIAIHYLLRFIRRVGFGVFAIYRFGLALAIVLVYLIRQ